MRVESDPFRLENGRLYLQLVLSVMDVDIKKVVRLRINLIFPLTRAVKVCSWSESRNQPVEVGQLEPRPE